MKSNNDDSNGILPKQSNGRKEYSSNPPQLEENDAFDALNNKKTNSQSGGTYSSENDSFASLYVVLSSLASVFEGTLQKMFPGLKPMKMGQSRYPERDRARATKLTKKTEKKRFKSNELKIQKNLLKARLENDILAKKLSLACLLGIILPFLLIPIFTGVSILTTVDFIRENSPTGNIWSAIGIAVSLNSGAVLKYYVNQAFHVIKWSADAIVGLFGFGAFITAVWQVCLHFMIHVGSEGEDAALSLGEMINAVEPEPTSYALMFASLIVLEWAAIYGLIGVFLSSLGPQLNPINVKIEKEMERIDQKIARNDIGIAKMEGDLEALTKRKTDSEAFGSVASTIVNLIKKAAQNS